MNLGFSCPGKKGNITRVQPLSGFCMRTKNIRLSRSITRLEFHTRSFRFADFRRSSFFRNHIVQKRD